MDNSKRYIFQGMLDGSIRVDYLAPCGDFIQGVAYIYDVPGSNPAVHIPKSLGYKGVKVIIEFIEREATYANSN